jgi:hypothetical protein
MLVYQRVFDLPRVKSVGSRMSTGVQRINAVWTAGVVEIEASKIKTFITGWWFQTFLFSIIYRIILPIDFHVFQDG